MAQPSPLQRRLEVQMPMDKEIANALQDAAREASRLIKALDKGSVGSAARLAQYAAIRRELTKEIVRLYGDGVTPALKSAMTRAATAAAVANADAASAVWGSVGGQPAALERALEAQAQATVKAYEARTLNNVPLSSQVYDSTALSNGQVHRVVDRGLLLGQSADEIAGAVREFIDPAVRGGVSYAADRLARTELGNAFHTAQIENGRKQPWITGYRWNISSSHPKPDVCNEFAENDDGMGIGVYRMEFVPSLPHPNCFCYITAETPSPEDFLRSLGDGEYSQAIDETAYEYAPKSLLSC